MFTLPSREFILILDPHALETLTRPPLNDTFTLIQALGRVTPPINVYILIPAYLATPNQLSLAQRRGAQVIENEASVPPLTLSRDLGRRVRERIERGAEGECRGLRLLALASHLKADGIVTTIASLTEPRFSLLQHHKLRVVLPEEFPDFVQVCGRGHLVACSATPPIWLAPDILYQASHWKSRRLFEWFNRVAPTLTDNTLSEHLRSALLNRYPFILQARDMVRFFDLQKDYYFRRGRRVGIFRTQLNYHLTAFYIHVWGMLDALAGIANRRLGLGLHALRCGISRDELLDALASKHPGLALFVKAHRAEWIGVIGDLRHPIAHSALWLQRDVRAATDESRMTEAEIAAIVREENREAYAVLPPEWIQAMEPMLIQNWRVDRMRIVSDDAIYVEQADGGAYFRSPVLSIDFDLERLNAFVDAFLVACFQKPP